MYHTHKDPHWFTCARSQRHTHTPSSITLACLERLFMCIMSTNTLRVNVDIMRCVCVCWHCRTVTLFTFLSSNYPCINQLPHRSPVLHLLTSFSSSPETDYLNFLSMLTKARSNNVLCVVEEARDRSWGQWAYVLVTFLLCDCAFIYYFFNLYCPCFISIYRHMRQFVSLTLCAFMHIGVWSEC